MKEHNRDDTTDEHSTVEEAWVHRLKKHGVSVSDAKELVTALESDPRIAIGSPDPETIRSVIEERLARTDLTEYGKIDESSVSAIRDGMLTDLKRGLSGELAGPSVLPPPPRTDTAQPTPDATAGAPVRMIHGMSTGDDEDTDRQHDGEDTPEGSAYIAETDERTVAKIKDRLKPLLESENVAVADLQKAVAELVEDYDIDE